MSSHNLPRIPVRFLPHNQELVKAQEGIAGQSHESTDYSEDVPHSVVAQGVQPSYRTPADRVSGNTMFRRYINGMLDYGYACQKVIDAIHAVKECGGVDCLNTAQKVALSVLFPGSFEFVSSGMVDAVAKVNLRLSPQEVQMIRTKVAAHLAEEMNWNAGLGGGSVPGRSSTKA